MPEKSETKRAVACNAAIAVLTAFAWCQMMFGWGWENFKAEANDPQVLHHPVEPALGHRIRCMCGVLPARTRQTAA